MSYDNRELIFIFLMKDIQSTLYYFHDPMCSWCRGFSKVFDGLLKNLPENIIVKRILGGLAPDTDEPMSGEMKEYIQGNWKKIEETIPGIKFNFEFWNKCNPRRSTYPACRAVIAARQQGQKFDSLMTKAIQHAYYVQARNPSDDETLIELASELNLDVEVFSMALNSDEVVQQLEKEIDFTREMFVESLPSLVLVTGDSQFSVQINYNDYEPMLESIKDQLTR